MPDLFLSGRETTEKQRNERFQWLPIHKNSIQSRGETVPFTGRVWDAFFAGLGQGMNAKLHRKSRWTRSRRCECKTDAELAEISRISANDIAYVFATPFIIWARPRDLLMYLMRDA